MTVSTLLALSQRFLSLSLPSTIASVIQTVLLALSNPAHLSPTILCPSLTLLLSIADRFRCQGYMIC